jgi:DNA-binding transcriptional LysR family regulator
MPSDPLDPDAPRAVTPFETALSRRVDLTTLRLFIAICEEQNLTRAANREGIAASAVSKRMNDFELAFGVTLFKRLAKGMALTPAGEALLHHARLTLLNVEKIAVELSEYSQGVRGHVRMLANLSAIVQFLPEDLSAFFAAHELLRIDLQERPGGQVNRTMRLRINVPGFDAVCRMVQANMGIGLIPDRAFEVVGAGMGLCAVRLRDDWARRELKIRDQEQLSSTGKLVLNHLRSAEQPDEALRA